MSADETRVNRTKTHSTAFDAKQLFRPRLLEIFNQPYGRSDLLADIMAGITVGLIALPLALALGIASVPGDTQTPYPPPAIGLFTAIFAGLVISSLGGSRVQIGGPTAAFIPIVLLIIEKYGYDGLILATLMAGGILIAMGFARMGTLIKFIPWPVTSGFTTGIAVSIMATQAVDFLGIHAESPPPREFFHKLQWIWENLLQCHLASLGLAFTCVLFISLWPRLGIKRVPALWAARRRAAAARLAFLRGLLESILPPLIRLLGATLTMRKNAFRWAGDSYPDRFRKGSFALPASRARVIWSGPPLSFPQGGDAGLPPAASRRSARGGQEGCWRPRQ
jgi:MFS superfamily sulfate permease-like transporter